ncbi:hypothetical protein [Streptomyces mirabilis]|uniref:hypothetical protein n=1 Tax=Streptomyces mirabilis TaxID=68239 RepID=UPI00365B1320
MRLGQPGRWPGLLVLRSIRWRLTLLYSALFMVAGALLLGFTHLLVSRSKPSTAVGSYEGYEGSGVPGAVGGPGASPEVTARK